jgi:TRAP-type uncharacterized transport system substrate-binding protein
MLSHKLLHRTSVWIALLCTAMLTALGIWLAFSLLQPTPPRSVTMATDPDDSFNVEVGKRYREILERSGIELKLVPTAGAIESLARLNDAKSGISIAIIPAGTTTRQDAPGLVSLGTLCYEPLWFFSRGQLVEKHEQLRGLRISIGPEGSASRALSTEFLARVGIIDQKSANLLSLAPHESAAKLLNGEIDAVVLVDAWGTPAVHQLLTAPGVNLVSIRRADAFVALYPYLNKLVLPAGVADMAENQPPTDVVLVAPKASLVVRNDLHPAIQYLLLDAASQIHSGPGVFRTAGQFPAPESIDLPLSSNARQFYKTGSPFLQRNLPFWLAVLIQQALVLLIPVAGVLYPLLRISPRIFVWFQRRRVLTFYNELKLLEEELASASSRKTTKDYIEQLDALEDRVGRLWVPPSLRPLLYDLRSHISLVRDECQK